MDETKVYGSSIMEPIKDEPEENNFEMNYDATETENLRSELKMNGDSRVEGSISTDAISGTKIYNKLNEFDESLEKSDIRGKTLPENAIRTVKDMTGVEITSDDCERIAKFFEDNKELINDSIKNPFDTIEIQILRDCLGKEVNDVIAESAEDEEDNENITRRLVSQIFSSYSTNVHFNDDMKELSLLLRDIKKTTDEAKLLNNDAELDPDELKEKKIDNLGEMYGKLNEYIERRKRLDERNKKLRADYSINDADTRTVSEVKEALEDALRMTTIGKYFKENLGQIKATCTDPNERLTTIKNWITSLKNDPETLYTLPCNDYLSISNTITEVRSFIRDALIVEKFKDIPIPDDYSEDVGKYYIEQNVCNENTIKAYTIEAELILYVLAKTFKPKRISNIYNRRVLSYTLDMLSKLSNEKYRSLFFAFGEYLYSTVTSK